MKKSFRNTSFLVELLINILVFSISCAILVGVFGKASQLARSTREENYASAEIHSMFELAKARGVEQTGEQTFFYDKSWNRLDSPDGAQYLVSLFVEEEPGGAGVLSRLHAVAQNSSTGREICSLDTAIYFSGEGGRP